MNNWHFLTGRFHLQKNLIFFYYFRFFWWSKNVKIFGPVKFDQGSGPILDHIILPSLVGTESALFLLWRDKIYVTKNMIEFTYGNIKNFIILKGFYKFKLYFWGLEYSNSFVFIRVSVSVKLAWVSVKLACVSVRPLLALR